MRLARAAPLEGVTVPHIRHSTLVLAKVGSSMSVPQLLQNTTRCGAGTVQPAISRSLLSAISVTVHWDKTYCDAITDEVFCGSLRTTTLECPMIRA